MRSPVRSPVRSPPPFTSSMEMISRRRSARFTRIITSSGAPPCIIAMNANDVIPKVTYLRRAPP